MKMPIPFEPTGIRTLAKLMSEAGIAELELAEKERRIRVVLRGGSDLQFPATTPYASAMQSPVRESTTALTGPKPSHPGAILSPMVGIVYLTPEPGAAPFIQAGARVEKGQTLLLIEAMKTFNPIAAPSSGVVAKILVEAGAAVDAGEPLLIIEP
jgi:acetyl-CoA carboxylase biotin carboxyl carrier protein